MATGQAITSWLTRSNVKASSSSSTRKRAWGLTIEVYRRYSMSFFLAAIVLLNSIWTRVPWIRSHSNGPWDMISGSFVSILIWISNRCADSLCPVREMTTVGMPLVELGIEDGCRDTDTLLTPGLPDLVEPRTVEEFSKNKGDLCRDDARAIVLDNDPEEIGAGLFDADKNIREVPALPRRHPGHCPPLP